MVTWRLFWLCSLTIIGIVLLVTFLQNTPNPTIAREVVAANTHASRSKTWRVTAKNRQEFEAEQERFLTETAEACEVTRENPEVKHELLFSSPVVVGAIVYINMEEHTSRREALVHHLKATGWWSRVPVFRMRAVARPDNGALGCFESHVHVLGWASKHVKGSVLVLEDDAVFSKTYDEVVTALNSGHTETGGRWDVMVLGQYVHQWQPLGAVYRLLHSTTTSAYLVHPTYVKNLFYHWYTHLVPRRRLAAFESEDHLDQIQISLQKRDVWVGFHQALAHQKPGESVIGHVQADNRWRANAEGTEWYDGAEVAHVLRKEEPLVRQSVAVCHVATGRYKQFVSGIQRDCAERFLKPHALSFFLFTDAPEEFPDEVHGCPIHKYLVKRQGFPGDTLYRYHYMLKAEAELKKHDFMYYTDVDYWVLESPNLQLMMPANRGLVATEHINVFDETKHTAAGHVGTPDNNPRSKAFIAPNEAMNGYYAGGVQGGGTEKFLAACRVMRDRIDDDDARGVMALWHDESHWNRYLLDSPPETVLSQSYIFPERCLSESAHEDLCRTLRNHAIEPVMLPLEKNHAQVRSA